MRKPQERAATKALTACRPCGSGYRDIHTGYCERSCERRPAGHNLWEIGAPTTDWLCARRDSRRLIFHLKHNVRPLTSYRPPVDSIQYARLRRRYRGAGRSPRHPASEPARAVDASRPPISWPDATRANASRAPRWMTKAPDRRPCAMCTHPRGRLRPLPPCATEERKAGCHRQDGISAVLTNVPERTIYLILLPCLSVAQV